MITFNLMGIDLVRVGMYVLLFLPVFFCIQATKGYNVSDSVCDNCDSSESEVGVCRRVGHGPLEGWFVCDECAHDYDLFREGDRVRMKDGALPWHGVIVDIDKGSAFVSVGDGIGSTADMHIVRLVVVPITDLVREEVAS